MSASSLSYAKTLFHVVTVSKSQSIESCVQRVLCNTQQPRIGSERRRETRHAYPYPIQLVSDDDTSAGGGDDSPIVVIGKHISNHGLDFYSSHPLPFRRAIVSFACKGGPDVRVLMDLTWCRFYGNGLYENGGRFLQAIG